MTLCLCFSRVVWGSIECYLSYFKTFFLLQCTLFFQIRLSTANVTRDTWRSEVAEKGPATFLTPTQDRNFCPHYFTFYYSTISRCLELGSPSGFPTHIQELHNQCARIPHSPTTPTEQQDADGVLPAHFPPCLPKQAHDEQPRAEQTDQNQHPPQAQGPHHRLNPRAARPPRKAAPPALPVDPESSGCSL